MDFVGTIDWGFEAVLCFSLIKLLQTYQEHDDKEYCHKSCMVFYIMDMEYNQNVSQHKEDTVLNYVKIGFIFFAQIHYHSIGNF